MRKEFVDKRAQQKDRRLVETNKKSVKDSKRETKTALDQHSLGWTTLSGEEF